jgi:hypothetical protein
MDFFTSINNICRDHAGVASAWPITGANQETFMNLVTKPVRRNRAALFTIAAALVASQAVADTAVCIGKITNIGNHTMGHNGLLVTIGSGNYIKVCSFASQEFSVTPEDCKHMASLAATAFVTDSTVTFYVDNAPTSNCADIPAWHHANTRFFALTK